MKKLIFIALITATALNTYSQTEKSEKPSLYIVEHTDEFTDEVYKYPNVKFLGMNESLTRGFTLYPSIESDFSIKYLVLKMFDIGSCVENVEIIFLFQDGSKVSLTSFSKFNCEGSAYFSFGKKDADKFSKVAIKKIKVVNGRTFDSYTHECNEEDSMYFVTIFDLCAKKQTIKSDKND
jgi:hypothetical protein